MMGHVMNLFAAYVQANLEPERKAVFLEEAGIPPENYRFEKAYPEESFHGLIVKALEHLDVTVPELENGFAEYFLDVSPKYFPAIFDLSGDAQTLLSRIPELHKAIPSAASRDKLLNKLTVTEAEEGRLVYRYDSPHKLCGFLQRACQLVLDHYGEQGEVTEHTCAREGADACLVEVRFLGKKAA